MNLAAYKALSFDCYGTLIDWETGMLEVLRPWAASVDLDADDEQLLSAYAAIETAAERDDPTARYPDILAESFRRVGQALGRPVEQTWASRLANSVPDWPAFEDSHDALNALGKHFQLIILSNVDRTSFAGSNARLGVEFSSVITAQDVGSYKPSARNFDALAAETRRLGIGEGKLLHVAQSLFHDHVPAKRVGLPTVWINRRHDRPGWGATPAPPAEVTPDWQFPSMAGFAAAVDAE
jgi:2-haloacid dehalogenase